MRWPAFALNDGERPVSNSKTASRLEWPRFNRAACKRSAEGISAGTKARWHRLMVKRILTATETRRSVSKRFEKTGAMFVRRGRRNRPRAERPPTDKNRWSTSVQAIDLNELLLRFPKQGGRNKAAGDLLVSERHTDVSTSPTRSLDQRGRSSATRGYAKRQRQKSNWVYI